MERYRVSYKDSVLALQNTRVGVMGIFKMLEETTGKAFTLGEDERRIQIDNLPAPIEEQDAVFYYQDGFMLGDSWVVVERIL